MPKAVSCLAGALLVCGSLGSIACGPSAAEMRRSQSVTYNTTFPIIWQAVTDEVARSYPEFDVENAKSGELKTHWKLIQMTENDPHSAAAQSNGTGTGSSAATGGNSNSNSSGQSQTNAPGQAAGGTVGDGALVMRVTVKVKGPPWRITIDGEAAEYKPGMVLYVPFHHGAADEPVWLEPRIDDLRFAIYQRLHQYAVDEIPEKPYTKRAADPGAWAKLPDKQIAQLIADVRAAAHDKNQPALEAVMDPSFTWAPGADGSAQTALVTWSADPTRLVTLMRILDGGCGADATGLVVTCPVGASPDAAGPAHAVFRKQAAGWRFVLFVAP